MNEARDLRTVFRLNGQRISAIPYGNDGFLKVFLECGASDHLIQFFPHFFVRKLHLPSDSRQFGRGIVRDFILRKNTGHDLLFHHPVGREPFGKLLQKNSARGVSQYVTRIPAGAQALRRLKKFPRGKRQCRVNPSQHVANIRKSFHGCPSRRAENHGSFFRFGKHPLHISHVGRRQELLCFRSAHV